MSLFHSDCDLYVICIGIYTHTHIYIYVWTRFRKDPKCWQNQSALMSIVSIKLKIYLSFSVTRVDTYIHRGPISHLVAESLIRFLRSACRFRTDSLPAASVVHHTKLGNGKQRDCERNVFEEIRPQERHGAAVNCVVEYVKIHGARCYFRYNPIQERSFLKIK
jgi:hypothetical protein